MLNAGRRILAMDTEYLIAMDIERIVRTFEPSGTDISTQLEFSRFLNEGIYALIVCDLDLLLRNDLLETLKQNRKGAAVVFTSTSVRLSDHDSHIYKWPVVAKPFLDETLLAAIVSSVEIAAAQHVTTEAVESVFSNSKGSGG